MQCILLNILLLEMPKSRGEVSHLVWLVCHFDHPLSVCSSAHLGFLPTESYVFVSRFCSTLFLSAAPRAWGRRCVWREDADRPWRVAGAGPVALRPRCVHAVLAPLPSLENADAVLVSMPRI